MADKIINLPKVNSDEKPTELDNKLLETIFESFKQDRSLDPHTDLNVQQNQQNSSESSNTSQLFKKYIIPATLLTILSLPIVDDMFKKLSESQTIIISLKALIFLIVLICQDLVI